MIRDPEIERFIDSAEGCFPTISNTHDIGTEASFRPVVALYHLEDAFKRVAALDGNIEFVEYANQIWSRIVSIEKSGGAS